MKKAAWFLAVACALNLAIFARAESKLGPGDPAPELKSSKWVKGTAVDKLEKDKVYVVEFWATWCPPCKVSIPHLTEIAKTFKGKAQVIGMDVWERDKEDAARIEKVEKFVKDMGEKMDYTVAMDTSDGFMAKNWMTAAGEGGIPCAFVIGKDGKIAWIGHPMSGLDKALEQICAGTYDVKEAAALREKKKADQAIEREKSQATMAKQRETFTKINEMRQKGDIKGALAELDKFIAENPEMAQRMTITRLGLLFDADEAAGMKEARKLADGEWKDNARSLSMLVSMLVAANRKTPNYDLAIEIGKRACELSKNQDAYALNALAQAYFKKGEIDKAIEAQEKALEMIKKTAGSSEQIIKIYQTSLEKYRNAKT
ncbi:MAG: redoxin family protein [Candidatus Sumerlaeota bacterium]|nr:redoxin family protein [Candidatus Sumerlaeota bacterium]